jgi:hypothetical protein
VNDLLLRIGFDEDVSESEADTHTRDLLRALEDLDVDRVDLVADGAAREGTRSADPATLVGALTVAGVAGRFVVVQIVTLATEWLRTSQQRSVTLEVEGNRVIVQGGAAPDSEQVEALVRALRAPAAVPAEDSDPEPRA